MKLSDFHQYIDIVRDGEFDTLGYVDSTTNCTAAYCDTVHYLEKANQNDNITSLITTKSLAKRTVPKKGLAISPNPRVAFYRLHEWMLLNSHYSLGFEYGIGKDCTIHPSAIVSKRTKIGNNVTIAENVVIKDEVVIGDNTAIDAGAVIGCDGLLYMIEDKKKKFIRHGGGIKIGKDVTILSNAVIVKSIHNTLLTNIGDNVIIGISSNIGHEAQIESNCAISNNCVIARRAKICEGAWIGPSSVIREHVRIGRFAHVKLGSIVVKDVKDHQSVSGNFALDHKTNLLYYSVLKKSRITPR